ncbi:GAF and ANTAR domain-containing protein [Solwaraspora sp. WMMD1047]|uniref:GAF and ANTAR domain-containing protein n=1 Tax=Solwaraspora sp. WMMD1047 TaxID=3016102 RepID=UPI00241804BC|nr:GAF and ANTAR domain-containing protein [Solwaraspora sp. WMMD1047]MDG4832808.1 GAF and ANTAR domain-containing protein [Solwaraspora sp. WMMD1047]
MSDTAPDRGNGPADPAPLLSRDDLAGRFGDLARTLHAETDVAHTLDAIVRAAVDTVPGAAHAGIMRVEGRSRITTPAATDKLVQQVDQVQYETGQGPCLTALYDEHTVRMPDVAQDGRWPEFAVGAQALGVGSMLSFQLYAADDAVGALNLYAPAPHAFDDGSEHVGLLFAAHAAVALANAEQHEQLTEAVRTRDLIGQAKGILMERYKLTGEQAFALLVRGSQQTNVKLRDLAEHLVHSGELTVRD